MEKDSAAAVLAQSTRRTPRASREHRARSVHKSGSYSNIAIKEAELSLAQGKMGETAAFGRPSETEQKSLPFFWWILENIGVDTIFGLCGHTVIALLGCAWQKQEDQVHPPRASSRCRACRRGYARVTGKPGVLMSTWAPAC